MGKTQIELACRGLAAAPDESKSFANVAAGVPHNAPARLFCAAFYMLQTLPAGHGVSAQTLRGVRVAFPLHFVEPGTVSRTSAKLFSGLQAVRERAEYRLDLARVDLAFDAADVTRQLEAAAPLIEELPRAIAAIPGLDVEPLRTAWRDARASVAEPQRKPLPRRGRRRLNRGSLSAP